VLPAEDVAETLAKVLTRDELAVLDAVAMKVVSGGGTTIDPRRRQSSP
jgi:hypothetical protein